jgi:uncharacterized protein (TIGR00288 family)
MVFADMENLAIRSKSYPQIATQTHWTGLAETWIWSDSIHEMLRMWGNVVRTFAFTTASGDPDAISAIVSAMKRTSISAPEVFKKTGGKSKKVDIALASQMLRQAFLGNFDTAVLMTGDGDFTPVVKAIQDMGKGVVVLAFSDGVSPELATAADECYSLDNLTLHDFRAMRVRLVAEQCDSSSILTSRDRCQLGQMLDVPLIVERTADSGPGARPAVFGANFGQEFNLARLTFGANSFIAGARDAEGNVTNQDVTLMDTYSRMHLNAASLSLRWSMRATESSLSERWFEIVINCADRTERTRFNVEYLD